MTRSEGRPVCTGQLRKLTFPVTLTQPYQPEILP